MLRHFKQFLPSWFFSLYHYAMAFLGAVIYRFPSRSIRVVAITGTKGKTTTAELLNAILEEAGHTTALVGTVRFKIADTSESNMLKMTMPGRFFLQRFLREAVNAGCDTAVLEMTSAGAAQFRHKWINLDALIFTNLAPEHIELHGSYEKYRDAKLSLARALGSSSKRPRHVVVNADDEEHAHFLAAAGPEVFDVLFSLADAKPYETQADQITFTLAGEQFTSPLKGEFNLHNILGAAVYARAIGVPLDTVKQAIKRYDSTPGRVEEIDGGQDFRVVVDYAHTPDSLTKLYETYEDTSKVCVLGNAGGGRDTWKRATMGEIADRHCDHIILTNEDPYDEDPKDIVEQMKEGIRKTSCDIIMDRREAIRSALQKANDLSKNDKDVAVLITGKGTDPYIMEAGGKKTPWSDAEVTKEELKKLADGS